MDQNAPIQTSTKKDDPRLWNTELAGAFLRPDRILVRGYDIEDMMQTLTFTEALYTYLTGEVPTKRIARMFDAMLIETLDYSPMAPAVTASRIAASQGSTLHMCIAQALLTHGGAHYGGRGNILVEQLRGGVRRVKDEGQNMDDVAEAIVKAGLDECLDVELAVKAASPAFPTYGHRYFEEVDPRAERLLKVAEELDFIDDHVKLVIAISDAFKRVTGQHLIIGGPTVRTGIMLDMGLDPRFSTILNETSSIARMTMHAIEEQRREKPRVKYLTPDVISYDGPSKRPLPSVVEK